MASIDANLGQLYMSIGLMFGAHSESQNKSARVKASWIARRSRITHMTPAWIIVEKGEYIVRPECLVVIVSIFEQCRDGVGLDKIAANLNAKGIPPFSLRNRTTKGWYDSYIRKLITGRTVLGEIQEFEYDGDVRRPKGNWSSPYPAAVSFELWQAANDALAGRRSLSGRKGESFVNLLQGLAICQCGAQMRIRVKGSRNDYTYYQCRDVKRGLCQHKGYINYRPVEALVLRNFGTIAHGLDEPDHSVSLALVAKIAAKRAALGEIETTLDRILAAVEGAPGAFVGKRIAILEANHATGLADLARLERELGLVQRAKPRTEDIDAIKRLIAGLDRLKGGDLYGTRARINAGLARLSKLPCK